MARFTDVHFRQLCKEQGADVLVTEFVQADAIVRTGAASKQRLDFDEAQRPLGVQVFGSCPDSMAEAARIIEGEVGPDFIDLNFGCPAERVTDQCAGAGLLLDVPRLAQVARAVAAAVPNTPVTAKIRIGWDDGRIVASQVAQALEEAGMQALTIHGRTKVQGYRGAARWDVIGSVASERTIPVVLNGGVWSPADGVRIRHEFPVRGIMIGRAAQGYPWIFREMKAALAGAEVPAPPDEGERWCVIVDYARRLVAGSRGCVCPKDIRVLRPKLQALTREMNGGKALRREFSGLHTLAELEERARLAAVGG